MRWHDWEGSMMDGPGVGWIYWIFGIAILLLFWGLVITALVLGIRWLIRADRRGQREAGGPEARGTGSGWSGAGPGTGGAASGEAMEILRQRYARGEIDEAEFEERRRVIQGSLR